MRGSSADGASASTEALGGASSARRAASRACSCFLAAASFPLPEAPGIQVLMPESYRIGAATAVMQVPYSQYCGASKQSTEGETA